MHKYQEKIGSQQNMQSDTQENFTHYLQEYLEKMTVINHEQIKKF